MWKKWEPIPLHKGLNDGLFLLTQLDVVRWTKKKRRERRKSVAVSHLEDFEVILRFFYQLSDGKVHSLSVPEEHETNQRTSAAERHSNFLKRSQNCRLVEMNKSSEERYWNTTQTQTTNY